MAYMERLGLWGEGTAFKDSFYDFYEAISAGGVGAMELVALDMKQRGMYLSRQLSFKSASFTTCVVDLTKSQQAMYDNAAQFWLEMKSAFEFAFDKLKVDRKNADGRPHPAKAVATTFWACHQRFFRQLCMAIKIPRTVEIARQALTDGKCVVIGLQSTGEARLEDALRAGDDLETFVGMKEMIRFLIRKLPTGDYMGAFADEHGTAR
eukprot:5958484-Prymnesium_polylepis.1